MGNYNLYALAQPNILHIYWIPTINKLYTINKKKLSKKTQTNENDPCLLKTVNGSYCRIPFKRDDFFKFLYLLFTWVIEAKDQMYSLSLLPQTRILKSDVLASNWSCSLWSIIRKLNTREWKPALALEEGRLFLNPPAGISGRISHFAFIYVVTNHLSRLLYSPSFSANPFLTTKCHTDFSHLWITFVLEININQYKLIFPLSG